MNEIMGMVQGGIGLILQIAVLRRPASFSAILKIKCIPITAQK